MSERQEPTDRSATGAPPGLMWIAVIFLALAAILVMDPWGHVDPIAENVLVDPSYLSKSTVRDPLLVPELKKAHFTYRCNECHQNFSPSSGGRGLVAEHTDIVLDHGENRRCLNCHNEDDWETLRDYEGNVVAFDASEELCRKCHGPKYADWVGGAHGRPNGHWNQEIGESITATCVQCHDPHSPRFKPQVPAPAPQERRSAGKETPHG